VRPGAAATLVRRLGLAPLAKAVMARLGRSEFTEPAFMCEVVRMKGLDRPIYRRGYLEKVLRRVEGGSRFWVTALSVPFHIELWDLLLVENRFEDLMGRINPGVPARGPGSSG
jgi:hypothetical protein